MGVKKLWELLEPTGSRVEISSLAGKRVAVDASIWLVQFIKAMRDERTGEVVKNAHLLGFFRRITRLLCNRVRPVFVFDGATPALKRHTVAERRKRRHQADVRLKSVAEKLLINRMRQYAALKKAQGGASDAPSDSTEALQPAEAAPGYDDALAAAEAAAFAEYAAEEDDGGDGGDDDGDDDDDIGIELPALGEGEKVDMVALAALPTSLQLEFIQRHREQQTAENRQRFAKASETAPSAFSTAQMDAYIAGGRVKRQLTALVREGAGAPHPDVPRAQRIAGDTTHEFVFNKPTGRNAGLSAPGRGVHAAVRAAPPPPEPRFKFSTLHPVLPPPMAGTVAVLSATPLPPLSAALPVEAAADEVVEDAVVPAAPAVHISFELPECVDDEDAEWEDVEPAAPAADAADQPLPMAAEAAKSMLAAALAQAAALNQSPPRAAAAAVEEAAVAAPMPMPRSAVFKFSHGFLNGRSLDEWDSEASGKAGPSVPPPPSSAEEQYELELAIQRSLSDAAPAQKPRAQSGVVISLLDDGDDAPRPERAVAAAAAAAPPRQRPSSPRQLLRASSPIVVDDDGAGAGAAGGSVDDDDPDLRAAIAASLGQAPAVLPPAVAELTVHFQGGVWRLSINEFGTLAGNLSSYWPPWLPSPLDLEEQPCTVRCAGQEWEVQTPMEESLLGILAKARRAAAGAPPPPLRKVVRKPATQMMMPPPPPPPPPPCATQPAPAPAVLSDGAPAWGPQWENVSSAWVPPAAPAARAPPPPPGGAAGRAATAEEEAELAALDAEAQEAMAAEFEREHTALQAEHRSAARQAETVSPEMYEEVQHMLSLFGIPYIIAPAEAEAQCAWLDEAGLVDGVVTDDSDVFLFGARTVYRHIFDAKKFVEVYSAERVQQRLGLDRMRLALLALLLGSDYTPGVQGVGPVNATEIVSAFPTMEALCRFKAWVDAPESDRVAAEAAKLADGGRRGARAKHASPGTAGAAGDDASAAASSPAAAAPPADSAAVASPGDVATGVEEEFKRTHRSKRKAWALSDSFPAQNVVNAYMAPSVDRSRQRFEWGRPDAAALRVLCRDVLGWSQAELEKMLDRVMQEYNILQTQSTMASFYLPQPAEQQPAKYTSKRLHKAIAKMTGREDPDLLLGELERGPAVKKARKARAPKPGAAPKAKAKKAKPLLASDTEPGSDDEYEPAEPRATRAARKTYAVEGAAGGAGAAEVIVLDDKE